MRDRYMRNIDYARISVTDLCNLRCIYCMPEGYIAKNYKSLNLSEIDNIINALVGLGVKKIRITGGEPLLREDIIEIIYGIRKYSEIQDIGITTNGTLLSAYAEKLKGAGLNRVNVSLDSLKKDVYKVITGGSLSEVLNGIEHCIELGMKVKINMVPIRGINDNEIMDFINLTENQDIDVRFIELMPLGPGINYLGMSSDVIKGLIKNLTPVGKEQNSGGPSEVYRITGYKGRVGFISPISHSFCATCNRLRITSDGKLKTCLHSRDEIDLVPVIHNIELLKNKIAEGILEKEKEHRLNIDNISNSIREMVRIGG
ncbi:hypothetical protein Q428_08505 [Fervidicella metallireducens AeB]|uniref:GTP 3',8-cyclase n=1 Tax=Fervidicella metallireducens AeB TaxID=1403537 RepID=A0A017RV86_9CLOT|nr:GTP 3',8-cyclase MoaA [Fervidicella metallireducens]EYE88339.1 hypothetical protein Q428_08505 [Fervidicella metallireducens AeB]